VKKADGTYEPKGSPLYPYLPDGEIRWCPTFKKHQTGGFYGSATGGYGYNDQYIGSSAYLDGNYSKVRPAKIAWIKNPTETIIFAAAGLYDTGKKNVVEMPWLHAPCLQSAGGRYDAVIHFRHNKKANVAFCDGHVESRFWDYPGTMAMAGGDTSRYGLGFLSPVPVPSGTVPADKRKLVNACFDLE
jgi:prepilin-type processing-associated H-X9-DG protein